MADLSLRKFVAPEFVLGAGARSLAGRYVKGFGARRVLLVTDPGVRAAGWADAVGRSLTASGIEYVVYDAISCNPRGNEVMAGVEFYRAHACDAIVAVGGGSPIDAAKGIGLAATNGCEVLSFEGVDKVPLPGPPLVCVPTTAGTGSEVTQFAILSDTARHVKIAIISKKAVPDIALVDPEVTTTMSVELTTAVGMDVLVHAFEAYVSLASSPITDLHALEAVRLVRRHLPGACRERPVFADRGAMMLASLDAGLAFSSAGLGLVHAMAHALGGLLDLPHGRCNALLLEHVVDWNFAASPARYRDLAREFGVAEAASADDQGVRQALRESLASFRDGIGLGGALGLDGAVIPQLAGFACADACALTNPRTMTRADVEALFVRAG